MTICILDMVGLFSPKQLPSDHFELTTVENSFVFIWSHWLHLLKKKKSYLVNEKVKRGHSEAAELKQSIR